VYLYGSSRLGQYSPKASSNLVDWVHNGSLPTTEKRELGLKTYELTDHLGNVRAVVGDDGLLKSGTDYYPFGMEMLGRNYGNGEYRFGFGGHEKVDEVSGSGNIVDMSDRWLDVRLGRTPKMDAKAKKYPDVSPYSYAANNPIFFNDPDGKEVRAYSAASQELVIKTLNYAFGGEHGFSFENNKLIHKGEPPKNLTPQQSLMFNYFNETLVKSMTVTTITANSNVSTRIGASGDLQVGGITLDGGATTYGYPAERKYSESEPGMLPMILGSVPASNEIVVTPSLIKNGINLKTEKGDKVFGSDHATLHEIGHAIMNTIMSEFKGEFNGINFNEMDQQQRSDWAIQFTNTLLQSQNKPLETGEGQHDRKPSDKPENKTVEPLTK
jgi:RHS repeat-associated protein